MKYMLFISSFFFITSSFAQVTGKVVNDKSKPLELAKVLIKNSQNGTITKKDGSFSIQLQDGSYTLSVAYFGFKTVEKKISGVNVRQSGGLGYL